MTLQPDTQHRIEALQMRHRRSMTELEENFGALGEEAQAFQLALSKLPVRPTVHLRLIVALIELYGRDALLRAMRTAIEYQTIDAACLRRSDCTSGKTKGLDDQSQA